MFGRMLLILALVLPLAACGRKPTGLQPPENAAADAYPQVYPKPLPGEAAPTVPDSDLVTKYKARPEQALQ